MTEATPRILAPYLSQFQGQTVRILGKVVQLAGETAFIDAGGRVTLDLKTNRDCHLSVGNAVEIIGKVDSNLEVRVFSSTDMGQGIDFDAANAVVDATHKYKEIFYE
ncbi:replication factor A protein 3 [Lophium mytilinum]|uniref:Replication factor A protein 3 n=1 Tax=Lophium mytilinum TaxID=390894 RepID=A0A6A6RER3_9PEZI|nr:replication factor A protein 3 [Lophium mytilinum]